MFVVEESSNSSAVPPKVKGKRTREAIKPLSDLNIESLLSSRRRDKISKDNAIAEFRQMLDTSDGSDNMGTLKSAAKQMGDIIRELIQEPVARTGPDNGKLVSDRVMENIRVMRHEMVEYDEPELYNKFIRALKTDLVNGNLGDDSRQVLFGIRSAKLGLIDNEISEKSDVSVAEAAEFLTSRGMDLPTRSK
jgi:ATP-dependent DNA helicase 2 subunit 2